MSIETFTGDRLSGEALVYKDGVPFSHNQSLRYVQHSPDGFEWAYAGSGPGQLAFAILLDLYDRETATTYYHKFMMEVICMLPHGKFELDSDQVLEWLSHQKE